MLKYFALTADKAESVPNTGKISNYTHFMELPLKCVGCWDWYKKPQNEFQIVINNIYLSFILFILANLLLSLIVHLYSEWTDIMASLDIMADGLPLVTSVFIVAYFAINKRELYEMVNFMNVNFKWRSARGLTNMTMAKAYKTARNFGYVYTACTIFSVAMYVFIPFVVHLWTTQPLQHWIYEDVTQGLIVGLIFLRQCIAQALVGLAVGQLGVLFACNAILLCGQLDLLCCSLRNVRYTALLQHGMDHRTLASQFSDIELDEEHNYLYNRAEMSDSCYHYDKKWHCGRCFHFLHHYYFSRWHGMLPRARIYSGLSMCLARCKNHENCPAIEVTSFYRSPDIYSSVYDDATMEALQECARISQVVKEYNDRFEKFVSPLLALRVIQVTLYLCTLLYAATLRFEMVTVEYLAAVALDIFVYCYYGNQIILQADRVSLAGYQSAWSTMGVKPRRMLLNILLANRKPMLVRAGGFLPMNLQTFLLIIKTSFSYYTLLVNVNE